MKAVKLVGVAALVALVAGAGVADGDLPAGYTRLDYIGSTGSQYINTGWKQHPMDKIECSVEVDSQQDRGGACLFGNFDRNARACFDLQLNTTDNCLYYCRGMNVRVPFTGPDVSAGAFFGARADICCEGLTATMTVGGKVLTARQADDLDLGSPAETDLMIFQMYDTQYFVHDNWWPKMKLYSFRITSEGQVVRDFVPVRREADNVVGLYDLAHGDANHDAFYGNVSGKGAFYGSDDEDVYLTYIESTGNQYFNTGWKQGAADKIECVVDINSQQGRSGPCLFGNFDRDQNACFVLQLSPNENRLYYCRGYNTRVPFLDGDGSPVGFYGQRAAICCEGLTATMTIGDKVWTARQAEGFDFGSTSATDFYIFQMYDTYYKGYHDNWWTKMKLYSFKITSGGRVVRDFIPYRTARGVVGLYDRADHTGETYTPFYTKVKGDDFKVGMAYTINGSTMQAREGVLCAADMNGFAALEKTTFARVDASGVSEFALPVTLSTGIMSFANGTCEEHVFDEALTLRGGAKLEIDVSPSTNDVMVTRQVVIDGSATHEHPVVVKVNGEIDLGHAYTICASGMTGEGVVDWIVAEGAENMTFEVVDGALVMLYANPAVPVRATWTNATNDGDPLNPANWTCWNTRGETITAIPMADTQVTLSDGCVFNVTNDSPFVCGKVVLPASLGGDCDWRGLSAELSGTMVLNGHHLYLSHFNGSATIGTDEEYETLEYLESTGTQYIKTGWNQGPADKIECSVNVNSQQDRSGPCLFGNFDRNKSACYVLQFSNTDKRLYYCRGWNTRVPFTDEDGATGGFLGQRADICCEGLTATMTIGGKVWTARQADGFAFGATSETDFYIFQMYDTTYGGYHNNWWTKMKLYSFKITSGGQVVRDFVPARRKSDNVLGLLDLAKGDPNHDEFYTNSGTGTFTGGPVVAGRELRGVVHVDIPANEVRRNAGVTFTGEMKVVKEGEGTYIPGTASTHLCGTDVAAGTIEMDTIGPDHYLGSPSGEVWIERGATFELNCQKDFYSYRFVLNGGTLKNTKGTPLLNPSGTAMLAYVRLEDDSTIEFTCSEYGFIGSGYAPTTLDLQGHTLDLTLNRGQLCKLTMSAGTVVLHGDAIIHKEGALEARETTLDVYGSILPISQVHVGDYICRTEQASGDYGGKMTVYRKFQPVSTCFNGCLLKDGVTIDLSESALPVSLQSTTGLKEKLVTFEDGAVITVELGNQPVKDKYVITWDDTSKPSDQVHFIKPPRANYMLTVEPDGLCAFRGLVIFVR